MDSFVMNRSFSMLASRPGVGISSNLQNGSQKDRNTGAEVNLPKSGRGWVWSHRLRAVRLVLPLALISGLVGMTSANEKEAESTHQSPPVAAVGAAENRDGVAVLDLGTLTSIDAMVSKFADHRLIYIGEVHDRYDHHLNQLAIIRGLHQRRPQLTIGLEFFQQPYQSYLDQFVAGAIDEAEMLRNTQYFDRWRFDYRLYQPILRYARQHRLPLIALNVPAELSSKVGRQGLESLSEDEKAYIREGVDRLQAGYGERLRAVFELHPAMAKREFETFLEAQLLWDEGMAQRVADVLREQPQRYMVVLAGNGHLEGGTGIPNRVQRRLRTTSAIVLNGPHLDLRPGLADFVLLTPEQVLPKAGVLGVQLAQETKGARVTGFTDPSAAKEAGLREGDRLLRVDGKPITGYADVRLALLPYAPGDRVQVGVERERLFLGEETHSFEVILK